MKCPNCGAKLSCGCKLRKASNGKQGCTGCIPGLEKELKKNNPPKSSGPDGTILRVTAK